MLNDIRKRSRFVISFQNSVIATSKLMMFFQSSSIFKKSRIAINSFFKMIASQHNNVVCKERQMIIRFFQCEVSNNWRIY